MDPKPESRRVPRPVDRPRGAQRKAIPGKKPGVGYPMPAKSYAGADQGADPYPMQDSENRDERYGPHWRAGAPGYHTPDVKEHLELSFERRTAWWKPDYDEWNGIASDKERDDLYYGQKGDRGYQRWLADKGWEKQGTQPKTTSPDTTTFSSTNADTGTTEPTASPSPLKNVEALTEDQLRAVQSMVDMLIAGNRR